ncbi:MAG: 16S rRNA (uracil(1498)-N(3))-methyltransferase [Lachnospiraceae bacterium]|nr:16S rRNA (uracil(1498)-N(3))-methyltransferase [Lachnospiraceae bacterium]
MYHFFVTPEQIGEREIRIEGGDINHIRNVLRMEPGEQITVSSGEDKKEYRCEIFQIEEDCVTARIMWVQEADTELPSRICLFQGLPKGDKMELIIQKAVELGVHEIVPVATKRAVVKLDKKKAEAKGKRWNAISESAAKQSKRMIVPEVKPVMTFAEAAAYAKEYAVRLIPYELAEGMERTREIFAGIRPGDSVAVFIGPEGGFDEAEIEAAKEAGLCPITLGRRILRTETAGMTVLSVLMLQLDGKSQ